MEELKLNYINIGPQGTFHDSGKVQTVPKDIDEIINYLGKSSFKKIAIHFHGGFNSEKAGMKIAVKMLPVYQNADSHPVTFVWETGLLETVARNINMIHTTKLYQKILKIILRHSGKFIEGIGSKGAGMPISYEDIEKELKKDQPFKTFQILTDKSRGVAVCDENELEEITADLETEIQEDLEDDAKEVELLLTVEAPGMELLDQAKIAGLRTEAGVRGIDTYITLAKALTVIVKNIVKRYIKDTDHGFYPTVVEEILRYYYLADLGAWIWNGMKKAAKNMWLENRDLNEVEQHAGTYFLEKLANLQSRKTDLVVDVIGHSAGSIAICEMINTISRQCIQLRIRNIIFLAPACTANLFQEGIINHPEYYTNFRMFTMHDAFEIKDSLVKGVYTRSLLYFISGVLEDDVDKHILGLQRYLTGRPPYNGSLYNTIKEYVEEKDKHRLVFSNTDIMSPIADPGFKSTAESHGDFDDDDVTLDSLTYLLKQ